MEFRNLKRRKRHASMYRTRRSKWRCLENRSGPALLRLWTHPNAPQQFHPSPWPERLPLGGKTGTDKTRAQRRAERFSKA